VIGEAREIVGTREIASADFDAAALRLADVPGGGRPP
jgi:hypothetical protein